MRRIDDRQRGQPARSWLPLYVAFAAVIGLLWREARAALTPTDHTIALLAIVTIFCIATWIWLGAEETE